MARPHELLVGEGTVDVGGVEEGDAELQGAVDCGHRFGVVTPGVEVGHPHAAEADGGDDETLSTEVALFHDVPRELTSVAKQPRRGVPCSLP